MNHLSVRWEVDAVLPANRPVCAGGRTCPQQRSPQKSRIEAPATKNVQELFASRHQCEITTVNLQAPRSAL